MLKIREKRNLPIIVLSAKSEDSDKVLGLSIVWHRHKVRADRAIAWFTGRVWLEVKLLLLVPFLWVCALAGMCCLAALLGQVLTYSIVRYLSVPLALWWAYLYINDLRYNFGHLKEQSLCAACVRLLRRQILHHPAAQRADRRMIWQFAACIPFFLFCALSVPAIHDFLRITGHQ